MNTSIYFGTDGIRGHADEFPFTPDALVRLGHACARWSTIRASQPKILIGHDTRKSCAPIKEHVITGLQTLPITIVDGGVLPTPAVYQLINNDPSFTAGMVISASHNPYTDNGIKLFTPSGKLSADDERTIEQYFSEIDNAPSPSPSAHLSTWHDAESVYIQHVVSHFPPNLLGGKTIVIDCAHGATYRVAPHIFEKLGATVITYNNTPNGTNINRECGALHPQHLARFVQHHHADAGFAFDGDGDRVVAVNRHGEIKDGDDLLAIMLIHPTLSTTREIVGTVMTNHGFEQFVATQGKQLHRTAVGDKYISEYLTQSQGVIGGETSGHIIIRHYANTGDGIFAALFALESIISADNWDMISFTKLPQFLTNVPIAQKNDLSAQPYATIIKKHESLLPNGRIVVRYSGTENVLRVMTEAPTAVQAEETARLLAKHLQDALQA